MKEIKKKNQEAEEKHICSICGDEYFGYGNNAQPVNDGRCCDECNLNIVVPYRIYLMREKDREDESMLSLCE